MLYKTLFIHCIPHLILQNEEEESLKMFFRPFKAFKAF